MKELTQTAKPVFEESARTQSRIKCLSRLLRELQKRELISPENVILLGDLVENLGNDEIKELYLNHRSRLNHVNTASQREVREPQLLSDARDYPQLPGEVRQLIADKIGRKWTDLARKLSVPDAEIDEIEERYRDNPRRINAMLIWFERRTSASKQMVQLINALNKSRRRDLAEKIETLL
ncbi:hypothetical protein B566_EDAN006219 [Ephemera danica]|nr:hypothetical protein B566_EDAN006219 [Ephemera danica]